MQVSQAIYWTGLEICKNGFYSVHILVPNPLLCQILHISIWNFRAYLNKSRELNEKSKSN